MKVPGDPIKAFEQGEAAGQALVYAQQVCAGAKLVASMMVKGWLVEDVSSVVCDERCQILVRPREDGEWADVWIYKYPFVRLILDEIERRGAPKSALDTWINGKLFGYSDYEIALALEKEGRIHSAIT